MSLVTRFAPSPTGYLHLGHALSAILGARQAALNSGRFLLRIEDLDRERCRPEYESAIYEDLTWLDLEWETPVRRQSEHEADYAEALQSLKDMGIVYPCFCSRRQIAEAIETASVIEEGPDGPHYPGTCRDLPPALAAERIAMGELPAWRLNARKAMDKTGTLKWSDYAAGIVTVEARDVGDVLLGRREGPPAYHLSVVVDDHIQGITLVTRGMDLFGATGVHRVLQALLGYRTPDYYHHRLIIDPETGHKLSKRDGSLSLAAMRKSGMDAASVVSLAQSYA
jgi:glutamyl-Q tRNA(Asp) synthetase